MLRVVCFSSAMRRRGAADQARAAPPGASSKVTAFVVGDPDLCASMNRILVSAQKDELPRVNLALMLGYFE
jgi:hypothetical protein